MNEANLKMKTTSKIKTTSEMKTIKNEDDLKSEDNLKNAFLFFKTHISPLQDHVGR